MDDELASLLAEAHHSLGQLEGLVQYAPNSSPFCELMVLKECTYSLMIDYDTPNFQDVLTIRGTGKGDMTPVNNLVPAYKENANMQFAAQDYSKLCNIALFGNRTEQQIGIRDTQTFLQRAISNLKTYNPTAPETVLPSLADIAAYLNDCEDDPLVQAALVHYQFEIIHPFEKYNGVVGRILPFMVLQKITGKALPALCLSECLYFNKNEYFDMLHTTQYSGGYIRWIKFFIRSINEAATGVTRQLLQYEAVLKSDEEKLKDSISPTKSLLTVYNYLKEYPISSIPTAVRQTNLSYNSISKIIDILQRHDVITPINHSTRNRIWKYNNITLAINKQVTD
ncbi:MAG: Fic family protein [Christensenellaceae bacterium]